MNDLVSPASNPPMSRLDSLDALRGIAALLVASYHTSELLRSPHYYNHPVWFNCFSLGGTGIIVFFILSGFVISSIADGRIGHKYIFLHYIYRRTVRIYPLYWLYLLLFVLLVWQHTGQLPQLGSSFWLGSVLLWPVGSYPFLAAGWTLTFELFFYLAYGSLIVSRWFFIGWIVWIATLLWTITSGIPQLRTAMNSVVAVASNQVDLLFFFGIAVFWLHRGRCGRLFGAKTAVIGAAIFLATGLFEVFYGEVDSLVPELPLAFATCLVMLSLLSRERYGQRRVAYMLVKLGMASYSIYLSHTPVLYLFFAIFTHDRVCWLPG